MVQYTYQEQADMIFMYGRANGVGQEAARLYLATFPNRHQPNHHTFASLFRKLGETGNLQVQTENRGRPRYMRTIDLEENILNRVEEDPQVSTRQLARILQVAQSTVWRVLHEQLLYPYHIQRVQALSVADYPARLNFCYWFLQQSADQAFAVTVLYTDEATFTKDGVTNLHNNHNWADENPHAISFRNHQVRFKVNVWVGIIGDTLVGPHFLPPALNGANYRHFLENELPLLMEDVPLQTRETAFFMHDGAPAHYTLDVRHYLDDTYGNRWIGRGGPVQWPARSPDLNPIDFYVWGHLKSLVYAQPIPDIETLRQRIIDSCNTIRNQPGIFERVRGSMQRRMHSCTNSNGGHIEHLL